MAPHSRFVEVDLLSTAEGVRSTGFASRYQPQCYFRTTDVVGTVVLRDTEFAHPGDSVEMVIDPGKPIAMTAGRASPSARATARWVRARSRTCSTDTGGWAPPPEGSSRLTLSWMPPSGVSRWSVEVRRGRRRRSAAPSSAASTNRRAVVARARPVRVRGVRWPTRSVGGSRGSARSSAFAGSERRVTQRRELP
ncbi:hypothetical protein [Actinophytocola oryzae]|uniref:EF-Tu C-terminal domain-related protein n=1 Tax=Actinophytocola oryzae TaxID=502181 RepID=UPI00141511DE